MDQLTVSFVLTTAHHRHTDTVPICTIPHNKLEYKKGWTQLRKKRFFKLTKNEAL